MLDLKEIDLFLKKKIQKGYIINILLTSLARAVLEVMEPRFFPPFYGPRATRSGHKAVEKNSVHNFPYGPRARLIRGMYC